MIPTIVAAAAASLAGGCASAVTVTSEPSGARVVIDGSERGRTPLRTQVEWDARRRNRITLDHPGCRRFATELRRTPRVKCIVLDIVTFYGLLALPFNSVGPVGRQHFALAPLPAQLGADDDESAGTSGERQRARPAKGGER
jgi:hypothetical protein